MVTKAIILGKNVGTNKYSVRIPWLENSRGSQSVYEATLSTSPSISESFNVDDVVYVAFENNQLDHVVIVGRLYTLGNSEPRGYANLQSLNVSKSASLPENTTLGGVSAQNLIEVVRSMGSFAHIPEGPDGEGDYYLHCEVDDEDVKTYVWEHESTPELPTATYQEALAILNKNN